MNPEKTSTKHLAEHEEAARVRRRMYGLEAQLAKALADTRELERTVARLERELAVARGET